MNPGSASLGYFGKFLNLSGLQFSHLKKGVRNSTQSPELVGGLCAISTQSSSQSASLKEVLDRPGAIPGV